MTAWNTKQLKGAAPGDGEGVSWGCCLMRAVAKSLSEKLPANQCGAFHLLDNTRNIRMYKYTRRICNQEMRLTLTDKGVYIVTDKTISSNTMSKVWSKKVVPPALLVGSLLVHINIIVYYLCN